MIAFELFSGSQSFRKVAEPIGIKCYSLDFKQWRDLHTDWLVDYMQFDVQKAVKEVGVPDLVWASPDCAVFSIASGDTHFDKRSLAPKTVKAVKSIEVVQKLCNDILWLLSINPNLIFWIENPNGRMKWLPFLQETNLLFTQPIENYRVVEFDQCAYGREYKKTTNLFTNDRLFVPKHCIGESCHHSRSNDGKSAWKNHECKDTKGGYLQRAMLPPALFIDLLKPYHYEAKPIHRFAPFAPNNVFGL